jgi:hypothetical protein
MPRNGSFGGDELDLMAEARRRRKDSCKETETKEDITTTLIFFEIGTGDHRIVVQNHLQRSRSKQAYAKREYP